MDFINFLLRLLFIRVADSYERRIKIRWITRFMPERHLGTVKALVVVLLGKQDGVMIRIIGLHDHFTGQLGATRATADLGQQLERPFRRPEIRQPQ
ncbi:hypothetical protein SDC9_174431 [bioreactor metagenome]|uniref:Uncharacterized protein n=1 Tax=bioreactor metagenome TaxID=1076179 RepID=A0A645GSM5_9ZZZZ